MAQKQITVIIDDLTGKELPGGAAQTITFSLDGVNYELDTDQTSADKLRSALQSYISAGRRVTASGRTVRRTKAAPDNRAVRAWAASHGIQLSDRGRIPQSVIQRYEAAGN